MKPREDRVPVMVPARLRSQGGWQDATIVNMSEHGLCLRAVANFRCGEIFEVRRGQHVIVAVVRWSGEGRCGARAQDAIPIFDFVNDRPARARKFGLPVERRAKQRPASETAQFSQQCARRFQCVLVGALGMLAAIGIADAVAMTLSLPLRAVQSALTGS